MGGFFQQKVLLVLRCGELLVGLEEVARDAMQGFNDGSSGETQGHEARQRDQVARVFHPDRTGGRHEKPFGKEHTQQDREGATSAIEKTRRDDDGEEQKQEWEAVEMLVEREAESEHGRNDEQGREITHPGWPAAGERSPRTSRTASTIAASSKPAAFNPSRSPSSEVLTKEAASPQALREVVTGLRAGHAEAIFLISDATVLSEDKLIIEHATALKMPVMAYELGSVSEGALAGYGLHYREFGRRAAEYVTRILAGTSPRDLPGPDRTPPAGDQPQDGKNARPRNPATLLARADEVIE